MDVFSSQTTKRKHFIQFTNTEFVDRPLAIHTSRLPLQKLTHTLDNHNQKTIYRPVLREVKHNSSSISNNSLNLDFSTYNENFQTLKKTFELDDQHKLDEFNLKFHARTLNLDFDFLIKESERVGKSLPSSRSMQEMKSIPYGWAELYENEAWALPQNHLLDKKFHWWRKMESWWKKSYPQLNSKHLDVDNLFNFDGSEPMVQNNSIFPNSSKIDSFSQLYKLSKMICQPIISNIFGVSVLGKRRLAINQWIVDVSLKFNFNCSTYSLCIQLLDSYLEKKQKSNDPVNIESTQELMVICVSCLMLSAAIREHWTNPKSEAYLSIIRQSSKHQFTFQDIILAQSDILNTIHPKFLASYIMFDYCLFFIAELRDAQFSDWDTKNLFQYIQSNGLLPWLFETFHKVNRMFVDDCVNLCVPGSRLAACFLIFLFSDFCGKDIQKDTMWFRLFSHYVLHMHFDGDISFWWTLLNEILHGTLKKVEIESERSKALFNFWKIASKKWVSSEHHTYQDENCTTHSPLHENRTKRNRSIDSDYENISPSKIQRILNNSRV